MKRTKIGFNDWLRLSYTHGDLLMPLICIGLLMFAAIMIPVIGLYVCFGIGVAFLLALRHAWKRDCKNPPWYLKGERVVDDQGSR